MRSPLALIEVPYHHPRTGMNSYEWSVVKTEQAARGLHGRRVVFLRPPTLSERAAVEACVKDSAASPKVFVLSDLLQIMGTKNLAPLSKILRGES